VGSLLTQERRIDAIDGWRAVSVSLVIVGHLMKFSSVKTGIDLDFSGLGVQIFFVISGFVIARGFLNEISKYGRISLSAFYVRRSLRIIPALVLYVSSILVLAYYGIVYPEARHALRALTFTCNFTSSDCGGWLGGHTWSLSVEEQFYLVIPFLFVGLGAHRRGIICSLAVLFPFTILVLYAIKQTAIASFLSNFVSIGFGLLCAFNETQITKVCNRIPRWFACILIAAIIIVWLLPPNPVTTIVKVLCLAPMIAFLLIGTVNNTFLASAPLRNVGRISYGVYLWQQLATYAFPGAGVAFYACSVPLTLVFCAASYRWFERPLNVYGAILSRRIISGSSMRTNMVPAE
jgi:peptidoglycan/LPS O-acetylase OafA/YrhL